MAGRVFETGATRDAADDKLDFDGFISPLVLQCFAEYMHANRKRPDGSIRDSDNWQLGIPLPQYRKSLWRHFFSFWKDHRLANKVNRTDACGILFNTMGMLHEDLKAELETK